ncbi:MAG: DUF4230 domain-containing protein [Cyclobacteriaceae bacterium]
MFLKIFFRILPYLIIIVLMVVIFFYQDQLVTGGNETVVNSTTMLERIETMGKVELVKYNFKEVLEITRKTPEFLNIFKLGPDSKAVLITSGEAVGCIDLTKVESKNIIEQQDSIIITLPQPELCYYKVNLEDSKLYSLQTGFFTEATEFVQDAYRQAEKQIKEAALQSNIMEQTRTNAELILKPLLEEMSGKKAILKYQVPVDSTALKLNDSL